MGRSDGERGARRGTDPGLGRANPAAVAEQRFPGSSDVKKVVYLSTLCGYFACVYHINVIGVSLGQYGNGSVTQGRGHGSLNVISLRHAYTAVLCVQFRRSRTSTFKGTGHENGLGFHVARLKLRDSVCDFLLTFAPFASSTQASRLPYLSDPDHPFLVNPSMPTLEVDLGAPTPLPRALLPKVVPGTTMALSTPPRALLFDVFGTCVDWRTTVTQALDAASHVALNSATASLASRVRLRASDMTQAHWGQFAQEWRNGYKAFTQGLAADPNQAWKTIDEHHLESLKGLLAKWELEGLWTDEEVLALSLVWHRLDPWTDSSPGIALLNQLFCMFTPQLVGAVTFNLVTRSRDGRTCVEDPGPSISSARSLTATRDRHLVERQHFAAFRPQGAWQHGIHACTQRRAVWLIQTVAKGLSWCSRKAWS